MTDSEIMTLFERLETAITGVVHESMEKTETQFKQIKGDIQELRDDIQELRTDVQQLTLRVDGIDRKLDAEASWRDRADRRIKRLEAHVSLPPIEEAA